MISIMGHNITQYMYTMYNDQIRVISISISSHMYHFYVLETLKLFSSHYLEIHNKDWDVTQW
jgi:hypothetical protein